MNQTDASIPLPRPAHGPTRSRRKRLLPIAAASALVPVLAAIACTAWSVRANRDAELDRRRCEVMTAARTVAAAAPVLIEKREGSRLAKLVADVARESGLSQCSILVADGGIVADSDPSRVTIRELPDPWPSLPAGAAGQSDANQSGPSGTFEHRVEIKILDMGRAVVLVRAAENTSLLSAAKGAAGLGVIAALAIGGALVVGRRTMELLRPLAAIDSAMQSLSEGETSIEALSISPRWGPQAEAWNTYLAARQADQELLLDRRVEAATAGGNAGEGIMDRSCDALPHGLLVLDAVGRVRYANGAAGALLGTNREALVGKSAAVAMADEGAREMLRMVAEQGTRRRGTVEVERGSGDEMSVLRLTCCRSGASGDAGASSAVLIEDLTQQRVADRSRDLFVTQATHELRTPLTNIRLYAETLLEGGDNDPTTRGECINVINQETRRLERMVSDMLSVAEIEAGSMTLHPGDVRVDALFEQLKADYQAQAADKQVTLAFDLPPKLPVIRGDRDKITMSLHNLIGNALKYTPAGGTVTVSVEESPTTLAVRVRDSGIGIAPDEAERIFEKFYRSKDRRIAKIPGTGLGLAIAREVVRLHGGDITVDWQIDHGSTFTLTLPHLAQAA